MGNTLHQEAAALQQIIQADPQRGAKLLLAFTKDHAVTKRLRHEALLLKLSVIKAPDADAMARVQAKLLALLAQLLEDIDEAANKDQPQPTAVTAEQIDAYFARRQPAAQVVFEAKNLGRTYQKTGFSLEKVNLQLRLGEITSVVGENGNGKTTLFNIVAGELRHDEGTLAYPALQGGEAMAKVRWHRVKREIAYIPQELPPWDGSLLEMLQFEAALHGIKGADNTREVNFIIQRLGLQDHLVKAWQELSGGFKLRFALAKALVWKPKLLIIDEPLANLDIKTQLIVLKDLRNMSNSLRYPIAVLLSSQHLHEIESVSDNILYLRNGEPAYYGPLRELGTDRHYNTFELDCDLTLAELKAKLADFSYQKLYHNGVCYVVTTDLAITHVELLQHLLRQQVNLIYYRNISQSVKKLFEL
ncbi:MAG: ABC transporter ATP-binding protein [Bacteroidota bacterium]